MSTEQLLFLLVMEECSEVAKIASKIVRFGINDTHPKQDFVPNSVRFKEELNDLYTVLDLISQIYNVDISRDEKMIEEKKLKIDKYMEYSSKLGRVDVHKL